LSCLQDTKEHAMVRREAAAALEPLKDAALHSC
jgi:hypothetical protein